MNSAFFAILISTAVLVSAHTAGESICNEELETKRVNSTTVSISHLCDRAALKDVPHHAIIRLSDGELYRFNYVCPSWHAEFELVKTEWIDAKDCILHEFDYDDMDDQSQIVSKCGEDVPLYTFKLVNVTDTFNFTTRRMNDSTSISNLISAGSVDFLNDHFVRHIPNTLIKLAGSPFNHSHNPVVSHVHGVIRGDKSGRAKRRYEMFSLFPPRYPCTGWWCTVTRTMNVTTDDENKRLLFRPLAYHSYFQLLLTLEPENSPNINRFLPRHEEL